MVNKFLYITNEVKNVAKFYGKNDIESTKTLFNERAKYQLEAFPSRSGIGTQGIRNFNFVEDVLYGRVDTQLNTVHPKETYLKYINSNYDDSSPKRALDFVVDAFHEVVSDFRQACNNNTIPTDDPYLSIPRAVRAFESPFNHFQEYMDSFMNNFIQNYLIIGQNKRDVLNIKQFVDHLYNYLDLSNEYQPITFTSWQRSKYSSIFTSGIAIDISGQDISDDTVKERLFINNPIFPFYLNSCKQRGFKVSKNAPWVMVADVLSPALKKQTLKYLLFDKQQIFLERYNKAFTSDLLLLRKYIFNAYNYYASRFTVERITRVCPTGKTSCINKIRQTATTDEFNRIITDNMMLEFYIKVRNLEEGRVFNQSFQKKLILDAKAHKKRFDISRAIGYIDQVYRKTYKSKDGGLNSTIRRQHTQRIIETGPLPEGPRTIDKSTDSRSRIKETARNADSSGGSSGGY